jgi:hypothetical protein
MKASLVGQAFDRPEELFDSINASLEEIQFEQAKSVLHIDGDDGDERIISEQR